MPVPPEILSKLASEYAQRMTNTRGKRVQRLVMRVYAGAEHVVILPVRSGQALLGVSDSGAALCATDGRGRHASVVRWLHGSAEAHESLFDLLKDSLPVLETRCLPIDDLKRQPRFHVIGNAMSVGTRSIATTASDLVTIEDRARSPAYTCRPGEGRGPS